MKKIFFASVVLFCLTGRLGAEPALSLPLEPAAPAEIQVAAQPAQWPLLVNEPKPRPNPVRVPDFVRQAVSAHSNQTAVKARANTRNKGKSGLQARTAKSANKGKSGLQARTAKSAKGKTTLRARNSKNKTPKAYKNTAASRVKSGVKSASKPATAKKANSRKVKKNRKS